MRPPERKNIRLKNYEYSDNGVYFITICTNEKQHLFWDVGAISDRPPVKPKLSPTGILAEKYIQCIPDIYPCVSIEKYTIMPNHVHLLISIKNETMTDCGRPMDALTISRIIQHYKGAVTKKDGLAVWQKSFYDHVVRDEQDFQQIWRYIDENPMKWQQDCYFGW